MTEPVYETRRATLSPEELALLRRLFPYRAEQPATGSTREFVGPPSQDAGWPLYADVVTAVYGFDEGGNFRCSYQTQLLDGWRITRVPGTAPEPYDPNPAHTNPYVARRTPRPRK